MKRDIIGLIKAALNHMGCPLSVMSNIDANSPIVFSFNNGVVMNLSTAEEAIWLWSPIDDFSDKLLEQNGAKFLELIMRPYPFFVTGKMHLSNENDKLVLQGLVSEESLEKADYFAAALQVFFDSAYKLQLIIKE
ncbi:MAG: spaK 2 [Solimicrobium sp.]|jgi:hypothetical protein|nr:spaK 2 [Solimicrobium sp.]